MFCHTWGNILEKTVVISARFWASWVSGIRQCFWFIIFFWLNSKFILKKTALKMVHKDNTENFSPICPSAGCLLVEAMLLLYIVQLFATTWTTACQASLSITNSWNLLKLMSIESVMPSNHLILCHSLLLLPSIFPSIRVFSNGSALCIRWPKYWTFSFNISPSNEHSGLMSLRIE